MIHWDPLGSMEIHLDPWVSVFIYLCPLPLLKFGPLLLNDLPWKLDINCLKFLYFILVSVLQLMDPLFSWIPSISLF